MKRNLFRLSLITLLTSCGVKDGQISNLTIVCPTGAPSIALCGLENNNNFETNGTPSNIVAMMNSTNGKDVVVIDTVSGLKAINNGADYKMAATLTFGNFYIASTGNDTDNIMDENDKIVIFGQGQTPDLIFHFLYGNAYEENIEYVTNVQDAAKCLVSGKNLISGSTIDYVFIAEPALTSVLTNTAAATYGKASVYADIQEIYKNVTGYTQIQASVFVKNSANKNDIDSFLDKIEIDVDAMIQNPILIEERMNKWEDPKTFFGVDPLIAASVTQDNNGLGLGFKKAIDIKEDIDKFLSLFNIGETNEEVYYK